MINIDGSYLEGGGQIVRTALALSTLTGKSFKVSKIRKGRKKPGLKHQHINAVKALQELCNAEVTGNEVGSTVLTYEPNKIDFSNINVDIGTAGSITLLLQALLPVVIFADKKMTVKLTGGTDTKWSMPIDYLVNVLLPQLRKYADFEASIEKRGYYPKGGGRLILKIMPKYSLNSYKNFDMLWKSLKEETSFELLKQGKIAAIKGVSHASKDLMRANVAERQARTARFLVRGKSDTTINIEYADAYSIGSGITLWAIFMKDTELNLENPVIMGADSLGEKGKKAEKVGQQAGQRLLEQMESGACVDKFMTDQILPYLALSGGEVLASEITDHARTNMAIIQKFLKVKFKTKKNRISC